METEEFLRIRKGMEKNENEEDEKGKWYHSRGFSNNYYCAFNLL